MRTDLLALIYLLLFMGSTVYGTLGSPEELLVKREDNIKLNDTKNKESSETSSNISNTKKSVSDRHKRSTGNNYSKSYGFGRHQGNSKTIRSNDNHSSQYFSQDSRRFETIKQTHHYDTDELPQNIWFSQSQHTSNGFKSIQDVGFTRNAMEFFHEITLESEILHQEPICLNIFNPITCICLRTQPVIPPVPPPPPPHIDQFCRVRYLCEKLHKHSEKNLVAFTKVTDGELNIYLESPGPANLGWLEENESAICGPYHPIQYDGPRVQIVDCFSEFKHSGSSGCIAFGIGDAREILIKALHLMAINRNFTITNIGHKYILHPYALAKCDLMALNSL
ncbi:hypothetical protein BB560_001292 [Smittium megazygosporum]|uniref:Uncharacterized protein n=1 Tax=Smittium megazygosporum TaxID=133381 RepID=A0A2T9ZI20_9FUNG|nr:hypothetical protein BB560_001292 [Smittium megazygosporum]